MHGEAAKEVPTSSRNSMFGYRVLSEVRRHHPYADACNARLNYFFLIIIIFIRLLNHPLVNLIII
jgi:hypothetical protein